MNASGVWRRLFANMLDSMLILTICAFFVAIFVVIRHLLKIEFSIHIIIPIISPIIVYLYYIILESSDKQASMGKRAMDIKVVTSEDNKPSSANIVIRTLLWIAPSILVHIHSYFIPMGTVFESGFDDKVIFQFLLILPLIWCLPVFPGKRTIYDKLSNTRVVSC